MKITHLVSFWYEDHNDRKCNISGTLKLQGNMAVSQNIQDKIRQEREREAATQRQREQERIRREQEAVSVYCGYRGGCGQWFPWLQGK